MFSSFKGFAVNFCLVVLFTAATACAQVSTVANIRVELDRPTDRLRTKPLVDVQKIGPDRSDDLIAQQVDFSPRILLQTLSKVEDESNAELTPFAKDEGKEGDREIFIPTEWIEEDLRKSLRDEVRFPSPVHKRFEPIGSNDPDDPTSTPPREKFHWKPAIYQSLIAQGFQHGYALVFQEKTQRALKGPFFRDYWESIKGVRGWSDGNRFFTNYIAHPMQGSMTGFIYAQNHDRVKKQLFNESKQYWKDRARALLWSAAWSTNWEIGPISQSTLGNVGLYGKQGYVDLVITPTVGTAWMITEEALDRYIIRHAEKNLTVRILLRTFLNPTRSVANILRFKKPWYRDRAN